MDGPVVSFDVSKGGEPHEGVRVGRQAVRPRAEDPPQQGRVRGGGGALRVAPREDGARAVGGLRGHRRLRRAPAQLPQGAGMPGLPDIPPRVGQDEEGGDKADEERLARHRDDSEGVLLTGDPADARGGRAAPQPPRDGRGAAVQDGGRRRREEPVQTASGRMLAAFRRRDRIRLGRVAPHRGALRPPVADPDGGGSPEGDRAQVPDGLRRCPGGEGPRLRAGMRLRMRPGLLRGGGDCRDGLRGPRDEGGG
jgi:hypothetical protein